MATTFARRDLFESKHNLALPLFPVKDGYITVTDKPGLGIDPGPEIVKRYQVC